jgi:hypothetical protein
MTASCSELDSPEASLTISVEVGPPTVTVKLVEAAREPPRPWRLDLVTAGGRVQGLREGEGACEVGRSGRGRRRAAGIRELGG